MRRLYITLTAALVALLASAVAPNGSGSYYSAANGKKGAQLKTALCGIIYNRSEQTYASLWNAFKTTDKRSDGKIWDMYSNITNYVPVTSGSNYSQEGDCYNREHSFPQSWFGNNTPMYTDLHHIYPTDGYVNGKRSNYPFGETTGNKYKSANNFSKLGNCSYSGYSGIVFEPADEYKGDFARTYFYMVTCYEQKLSDWVSNYGSTTEVDDVLDGNTYPGLKNWQLNMLLEWAENDPVSDKEVARNNAVKNIQGNRNPFIDYPGLEQYIWGSCTETEFSYNNYVEPTTYSGYSGGGQGGDDPGPVTPGTYKLTITKEDFNGTSYAANNNEKTSLAVCTTDATKTYEVKWTSYNVMLQSDKMQWKSGNGYIYNSTDLGTIVSVTVNKTAGTFTTYYGTTEQPSSSTTVGDGYFKTCVGNETGKTSSIEIVFTIADGGDTPEPVDGGNYFTKITSMDDLESGGTYLIVYETGSKAFDGSLTILDAANNNLDVTISDHKIEATPTIMASTFTITAKTDGYSVKSASGYYIGNTSNDNALKCSDSDNYTNSIMFGVADGNVYIQSSGSYLRYNKGTSDNRFRYYKSSSYTQQQAIQLYKYIAPPSQTVSVGEAGYATMVAEANLEIPSGVEVFAVQVNDGNTFAHLEPITGGIPAGEAVVVKADEGSYSFTYASDAPEEYVDNDLVAATTAITSNGTQYCLANKALGIGFYQVKSGITIPKDKAYLIVVSNLSEGVKEFYGFEEDDATGIEDLNANVDLNEVIYNLAGQRLQKTQKGINIVGGKKILR